MSPQRPRQILAHLLNMRATILAALAAGAAAAYGVDISSPLDLGTAQCMVQNGVSFAIVRGWCSFGGFDSNVAGSVANLWSAGAAHVDTYMFPCAGQDPASQVNSFVSQLSSNGVQYGMIWLDIETNPSDGCGWSDATDNCNFFSGLANALNSAGVNWGTYSSPYEWSNIMGGCTAGSSNPLWYADWDGEQNFDNYPGFGGWNTPAMKQFTGDTSLCGFDVDQDWYPDSAMEAMRGNTSRPISAPGAKAGRKHEKVHVAYKHAAANKK